MSAARESEAGDEFRWPVRVYHEDTDGQGVVYHANFLKYYERARTEWLRSLGWSQAELRERHAVALVVRRMEVGFVRPAYFDERLEASARMVRLCGASLTIEQTIARAAGAGAGRELVNEARVRIACIDAVRLRPRRWPEPLLRSLQPQGARGAVRAGAPADGGA